MSKQRRLVLALVAAAGGVAAATLFQTPFANADACDLGECTLVSGGEPTDVVYSGFRPLFEEWTDDQPTNVEVAGGGISGSYDISELDAATPYFDDVTYKYGDFTPAADNTSGIDSEGLSGATLYDDVIGPGAKTVDGVTTYDFQNLSVFLANGDHIDITTDPGVYTNYLYSTPTDSGDWIEYAGSSTPTLVYDTLPNPDFPTEVFNIADYFPPDHWFPDFSMMFPPDLT